MAVILFDFGIVLCLGETDEIGMVLGRKFMDGC